MSEQHTHQCGLTALGVLPGVGCGHRWSHTSREDWLLSEHYCPKCGRGPFTFQVGMPRREVLDYARAAAAK